jgi:hypothetical protein
MQMLWKVRIIFVDYEAREFLLSIINETLELHTCTWSSVWKLTVKISRLGETPTTKPHDSKTILASKNKATKIKLNVKLWLFLRIMLWRDMEGVDGSRIFHSIGYMWADAVKFGQISSKRQYPIHIVLENTLVSGVVNCGGEEKNYPSRNSNSGFQVWRQSSETYRNLKYPVFQQLLCCCFRQYLGELNKNKLNSDTHARVTWAIFSRTAPSWFPEEGACSHRCCW